MKITTFGENPTFRTMFRNVLFIMLIFMCFTSRAQKQNILLEWYTTTPTPFATDGYAFAETLRNNYNVIDVGIHAGYGESGDAMYNLDADAIDSKFKPTGYPMGMLNRTQVDNSFGTVISRQYWENYADALSKYPVLAQVKIDNNYNNTSRKLTLSVDVDYLDNINQETRLYMYLVEDSVIGSGSGYDQRNYYNTVSGHKYYGAGDPITNFPHRNVLRENILGLNGHSFGTNITKGSTKQFDTTLSISNSYNEKQVYIVAFVGYYNSSVSGNEVLNVSKQTILPTCQADFAYSISDKTISITNNSKNYTSLKWNFGDGNSSTNTSPNHTYQKAGTYKVSLTLYNGSSTCSQIEKTIVIPYTCKADFTYLATQLKVEFTNLSTGDADSYTWDFDDGTISSNEDPTHTFNNAGTYKVTLSTKDPSNNICDKKTINITVSDIVCQASFNSQIAKKKLTCTNTSTGNYKSVKWNFGDGNSSTQENPVYTYSNAGTYKLELELYDANNDVCDATSQTITINDDNNNCNADFTHSNNKLEVTFTNKSSGGYEKVWWSFGDGFLSTNSNPIHTYTKAGNYNTCLAITIGSDTCHQKCVEIEVSDKIVGTAEPVESEAVIWPNPTNGILNINFIQPINKVNIYSANGQLIDEIEGTESSLSANISHLQPSLYILEIIGTESRSFHKIRLE